MSNNLHRNIEDLNIDSVKDKVKEANYINKEESLKVFESLPPEEDIYDLADFYKLFSDSTRLKILIALQNIELCVTDLSNILEMEQSAISHQLRVLKQARLIKKRRAGKVVYYGLDDEHISEIIKSGLDHIIE